MSAPETVTGRTRGRRTAVYLDLPHLGTPRLERFDTRKAARAYAEEQVRVWTAYDLEVTEDADGDLVVQEVAS